MNKVKFLTYENRVSWELDKIKLIDENNNKIILTINENGELDDESIDKFQIFFPDPWHKAKHHKRRIIQQAFVQLLLRKLKIRRWVK